MGDKGNSAPKIPKAPDPVDLYKRFTNAYFGFQPQYVQGEDNFRGTEDPTRIQHQQDLQNQFGPEQYKQMTDAFNQLDPQYAYNHAALGNRVASDLSTGGPFAGAYASQYGQGQDLVNNLESQYKLGTQLSPSQSREIEQGLRGSQAARGNASGTGAGVAEAYALGDRGQQMQQQRLGNLESGLGIQGTALGAASGYNQQSINNAGSFLGSPTIAQQASFVPPVSADRSFAYVNPNAGFQGVTLGNQGYANQLGAAGLNQQTGGNPWMSAIGALGSVAGGLLASGAFSDERLKTDIKKVGKDEDGLNLYEFSYKSPKKYIGHMAQEVKKHDPSAVFTDPASGYFKVTNEYAPVEVS